MSIALSLATHGMACCSVSGGEYRECSIGGDYMELPRKPLVIFKGYNTIEKNKYSKDENKITINASLND